MEHVRDAITERVRGEGAPVKLVVLDLSSAPYVDLQSAHAIGELAEELTAMGIQVQVVEGRSSVRERLRGEGLGEKLGGVDRITSVADVVDRFQRSG